MAYDQDRFNVRSISEARAIILTAEDSTTAARWDAETPYLAEMIIKHLDLQPQHRVLDFGCGIGRLSKVLIEQSGCSVVGVDTSLSMRALAPLYVQNDKFLASPARAMGLLLTTHYAIAVWTLQHIPDVEDAIRHLDRHLRSYGRLFVVNGNTRALPEEGGRWVDDGLDVRELLLAKFKEVAYGQLDPTRTTPRTARNAFWGVYQRRN